MLSCVQKIQTLFKDFLEYLNLQCMSISDDVK